MYRFLLTILIEMYTIVYTMIRLSISEAAKLFGVNEMTIRRAIKQGKITYAVVGSRYKLNFESVLKWSQEETKRRQKLATAGIGQYVSLWKIKNTLYSPNPEQVIRERDASLPTDRERSL